MKTIIKRSFHVYLASYKKYIAFGAFYTLVTSFLFVPIITFVFNRLLKMIGTGSLLNGEVYKVGLSYKGIAALIVISFLAAIILLVEFGTVIIISQKGYFRHGLLLVDAFYTTIRKVPHALSIGLLFFIFISIFIFPFVKIANIPALLDFNIPIYLNDFFYKASGLKIGLYLVLLVIVIFTMVRFVFTLHYFFIEGKTIVRAMGLSWKLTKTNKLLIISSILVINVILFVSWVLFIALLAHVSKFFQLTSIGIFMKKYLMTISSFLTISFSIFLLPMNMIILTRLFYRFKRGQGEHIKDRLVLNQYKKLANLEQRMNQIFNKKRYLSFLLILLVSGGVLFITGAINNQLVYLTWDIKVAAHRGVTHHAPENSLSSVRAAIEQGVDVVEVDVMLTKDHVVILNHDKTFKRVAGISTKVSDLTYDEISQIEIAYLQNEEIIVENIPSLEQVLFEMKMAGSSTLLIDLKPGDKSEILAEEVVKLVEKHDMVEDVYIQAFDNTSLRVIRNRNEAIKIGQILYLYAGNLASLNVDFYTIRQTMLSERFIQKAHKLNREVWVWTVNIERNMSEVLKYNIDGIITDYPEKVQQLIGIEFIEE